MKPFHYVILGLVLAGGLAGSILLIPGDSDLGLMYFRGHQYTDAQPVLEKRLAAGDRSVNVIMPLAELYVQSGEVGRAVGLLRQMAASNPDRLSLLRRIAAFQKYNQQMQDYLRTLEVIERIAGSEDGLRELTVQYRYANDNAKLIPALQVLIARYPGEPSEFLELANLLAAGSRFADAANVMKRFETSHPRDVSAESVELMVSILLDSGQGQQALDRAARWVALHPDPDSVVRFAALLRGRGDPALAAQLLAPFEGSIDSSPVLLAEWLEQQSAAGRNGAAFERLDRLRRAKRLPDELFQPLISLALAKGDLGAATEAAGQLGFHRLNDQLRTILIESLLSSGQAAAGFRIALASGADFAKAHPLLEARLAFARGDWAETARHLRNAESKDGLTGADRLAVATLDVSLGRQMEAAAQLDRIPLDSGPADLLLETARLYVTVGKPEEGVQRFSRIRGARSAAGADQAWAMVATASGRGTEVAQWMQAALPGSIPEPLLRDLFYLAQDHKQLRLAVVAAERLFNEHAGNANRLMLAKAYNAAGQPVEALAHARVLLSAGEPEAEDLYTAALLGAVRAAPAASADGFRKELLSFWSVKLGQARQDERKQLDAINGLLDLGAWDAALPSLATLARRREDIAPLFVETAIKAGNRKAVVEFLEADLARPDLSRETRVARVYALLEHGGQEEALPYMQQLANAGLADWTYAYEDALKKLGRGGELLDFWRHRLADQAIAPEEKRGIGYKLIDLGKPEYARSIFAELASAAAPDDPDVAEWLFLEGTRPGPEVKEWLEDRARKARGTERIGWLTRLLEAGAPDRVAAVVSADPPASGKGGELFGIYVRALSAAGATNLLAEAIAREAGAAADRDEVRKLAALARETGGVAAAVPAYERLVSLAPGDSEALHWLGTFAYSRARYSVADRYLGKLLASAEGGFDDNFYYAEILWRAGSRSQARVYYGRAMRSIERMAKPPVEARSAHAKALFRCGYMDRALREYRTLIADEPRNGDVRADFAALLLEKGEYDEADDVLSGGVDSGAVRLGLLRAQLLSATGHRPAAMDLIQDLADRNPQLANVASAFGVLEQGADRKLRARDLLSLAVRTDPGNEDYQDALAAIEKERAGQLQGESEYRRIQGAQSEEILRLAGQGAVSRNLRVFVSAEQDQVSIRDLQKSDGSRGPFSGVERRGEADLEWELQNGMRIKGSLFSGDSSPGGGVIVVRPDLRGSTTVTVEEGRPDWDFRESLAQGGTRDRIEVRRDAPINARITAQAGVAVNRYNLPGIPGAARSVAATGNVSARLLRAPSFSLNYALDGEYLLDSKGARAPDGAGFRPLPLVSREVHATSARFDREVTRGLHVAAAAGVAVDRFGGVTPFFNGSVGYDRSRHFGARLDYERRTYQYNTSQTASSVLGWIYWRF
jgi:Tfp pilus assembly protein PilF